MTQISADILGNVFGMFLFLMISGSLLINIYKKWHSRIPFVNFGLCFAAVLSLLFAITFFMALWGLLQ